MGITIGAWDVALIVAASLQATAIAYVHSPKWKALVLTFPIPFTLSSLALGRPVDATNVLGMVPLFLFTHGVRWMHYGWKVPILPAIVASALGYCAVGAAAAPFVPSSPAAFWVAAPAVFALGVAVHLLTRSRTEPGHRSPLPVWIKLPVIAGVILVLVLTKQFLLGFMTMFPMVGVVTAYEARHSLWTICRQIPIVMMVMTPTMVTCRLAQDKLGLGVALALGWCVFLAILIPITLRSHLLDKREP